MAPQTGGYRSYVDVDTLEGQPLVSNKQCAGLVQWYTRVGNISNWKEDERVKGNMHIKKGTAIATFVNASIQMQFTATMPPCT